MKKQPWEVAMGAMRPTLKVGDKVCLNDAGLEQCFGHTIGLNHMKAKVYVLTAVSQESLTYPEPSFSVEVDDPELNRLLLDDYCFDRVEGRT
jgi:hypothetical protein